MKKKTKTASKSPKLTPRQIKELQDIQNIIGTLPKIEKKQEYPLIKKAQQGCKDSMTEVIQRNLAYITTMAKRYINNGLDMSDIVGHAIVGFIHAVMRFDMEKNFSLRTYATFWIKHEIINRLTEEGRLIRLPAHVQQKRRKYITAVAMLESEQGRKPEIEEIAKKSGLKPKEIGTLFMEKSYLMTQEFLDIDAYPLDSKSYTQIKSEKSVASTKAFDIADMIETLANHIKKMSKNDRTVLTLRFGLFGHNKMTLREIASKINLTSERVRQIEKAAIERLKNILERYDLTEDILLN